MPQIFPRRANYLPAISLIASLGGGVFALVFLWYYFVPSYTDVGYMPDQPVDYSHRLHAGHLGLYCRYCHTNVESTAHSNIPATQTCMNCHAQIKTESLPLVGVRESWATGNSIEWVRVHKLPDYAHFSHSIHINNGVGCETCHGRVDQMERVRQEKALSMRWCLDCHRAPEQHLRPISEITTMGYEQPIDFLERNLSRMRAENIRPPTNCSACHY